jgi:hypothetical protein
LQGIPSSKKSAGASLAYADFSPMKDIRGMTGVLLLLIRRHSLLLAFAMMNQASPTRGSRK